MWETQATKIILWTPKLSPFLDIGAVTVQPYPKQGFWHLVYPKSSPSYPNQLSYKEPAVPVYKPACNCCPKFDALFSFSWIFLVFFWGGAHFQTHPKIIWLDYRYNEIFIELYRYFPLLSLEVYWTNLWYIQSSPYRPRAVGAPSTKVDTSSVPVRGGKAGVRKRLAEETLQGIQLRTLIQGFKKGLENVEWSHSLGLRMMRMLICRDVEFSGECEGKHMETSREMMENAEYPIENVGEVG